MSSSASEVAVEIRDTIAVVRLMRPAKRNALSDALMAEIDAAFAALPKSVGCAVLTGSGDHFSAGLDLSEIRERDAVEGLHHSRSWHRILGNLEFGRIPVVAALHGAVVGGGLELASSCHIRVADDTAFFALPEGSRGIFVGGAVRWLVDKKRAGESAGEAEFSPGMLMASGLIAGGSIAGVLQALISSPGIEDVANWSALDFSSHLPTSLQANHGWWPMMFFLIMAGSLYYIATQKKKA